MFLNSKVFIVTEFACELFGYCLLAAEHAATSKAPSPLPPSTSDASEQDKDGEKKHARWRLARKAFWRVAGDHDGGWRASLDRFFALSERGSSLRNEALAGFVCFLANAYQARP